MKKLALCAVLPFFVFACASGSANSQNYAKTTTTTTALTEKECGHILDCPDCSDKQIQELYDYLEDPHNYYVWPVLIIFHSRDSRAKTENDCISLLTENIKNRQCEIKKKKEKERFNKDINQIVNNAK